MTNLRTNFIFFLYAAILGTAFGHGTLSKPAPRGLQGPSPWKGKADKRFTDAPVDKTPHFPAGYKGLNPGDALRSQAHVKRNWTPFTPMRRGYTWAAGVCGDPVRAKPGDHMAGGKLFYDGFPTAVYREGQDIEISYSLVANHNGYIETHICDVDRCGGEISPSCFKTKGACHLLKRAPNKACNKTSKKCGPIDRIHPSRFYVPCMATGRVIGRLEKNEIRQFGGKFFKLRLPHGFKCHHCVLHYMWVSANLCNPPGVMQYYNSTDRPGWGSCRGQAGARGGVARGLPVCGGRNFGEEYYNCADVRIVGAGEPRYTASEKSGSLIKYVQIRAKNQPRLKMKILKNENKTIVLKRRGPVDFIAVPGRPVNGGVSFQIAFVKNGNIDRWFTLRSSRIRPFNLGGIGKNGRMKYWPGTKFGTAMLLKVKTEREDFVFTATILTR